eukprot:10272321-Lingulodinium_polyedra.AAC.1
MARVASIAAGVVLEGCAGREPAAPPRARRGPDPALGLRSVGAYGGRFAPHGPRARLHGCARGRGAAAT